MKSKYFEIFSRLRDNKRAERCRLRGPILLVEVLPKEELRTTGGLIIGRVDTHRATAEDSRRALGIVLMTGNGYDNETPCELDPGMLVMLPTNPLYLSEFPGLSDYTANTLALVNEADILITYESIEGFDAAKVTLNTRG